MANLFYTIYFVIFVKHAITEFRRCVILTDRIKEREKSVVPYKRPGMILRIVMSYPVIDRMT